MIRECLADGSWSGQVPRCVVIMCSLPPEIENGNVFAKSTTYESIITYVCDYGYELHGGASRVCQSKPPVGWSGSYL